MRYLHIFLFSVTSSFLFSQTVIDPNLVLMGSDTLPHGPSVSDQFLVFDAQNAALHGGRLSLCPWNRDSLGLYSFGWGFNVKASGEWGATALGLRTTASGDNGATALGISSIASGHEGATALGYNTTASGDNGATALGFFTEALGGVGATALGRSTTASGENGATALGIFTDAAGDFGATALGRSTTASGDYGATAIGRNTIANGNSCTVVGVYNDTIVHAGSAITSSSPLFIVGNGDAGSGNQSNALVVRKDGHVGLGSNDPASVLHLLSPTFGDSSGLKLSATNGPSVFNSLIFHDDAGNLLIRKQNQPDQFAIATNGNIGIGKLPTANDLEVEGTASKTAAGSWLANSDRRIKTNIEAIENGMELVQQLRPVRFKYTEEWKQRHPSIQDQFYYNFIAQEYQDVFPESVQGSGEYLENDDEEILQVDTYNAQIVTLAAVKELVEENTLQKEQNALQKEENRNLQKQIDELKEILGQLSQSLTSKVLAEE